jgi:integrase/recombinase XerD
VIERPRPGRPPKDAEPVALAILPSTELAALTTARRDAFEEAFQAVRSGLNSDESRRAYKREWGNYVAFLIDRRQKGVLTARTGDVQSYLEALRDELKLKRASRARALAVLRVVYSALVRFDVMEANPAREAQNPKSTTDQKTPVLTEAELRQFIQVVPSDDAEFAERRNYLLALTASYTGLRRSNLASIAIDTFRRHEDDSGDWLVAVRVKGDKRKEARIIAPLANALLAWCREHSISTGPIFRASPTSARSISLGTVRNALKNQGRRAGIQQMDKITPHAFRRTFASMAKKRNANIVDIQRELMHSRVSTTEGYFKYDELPVGLGHSFEDLIPASFQHPKGKGAGPSKAKRAKQ